MGERRGRWTLISKFRRKGSDRSGWLCQCECGTVRFVSGCSLGRTSRSCGCLARESTSARSKKHGHSVGGALTRVYSLWRSIKQRCYDKRQWSYRHYGARGIGLCDRWLDFNQFAADIGEPPLGLSFDRINNDGNYEPGNVRWVTAKVQANNTRRTVRAEWKGQLRPVSEIAEMEGVSHKILCNRLHRGWTIERAVSQAPKVSTRVYA